MSKSSKHRFTPELFGEQKGEHSPFFHTQSEDELRNILLNEHADLSFLSEGSLDAFRTFSHKETQEAFLKTAEEAKNKRHAIAAEIHHKIKELASEMRALARTVSEPIPEGVSLTNHCVHLVQRVEEKECETRTKILIPLEGDLVFLKSDNNLFQIKEGLLLLEAAQKALGALPLEWEEIKKELLSAPPEELASEIAKATEIYVAAEHYIAERLVLAAKEAKGNHREKYNNFLQEIAARIFDAARALDLSDKDSYKS